VQNMINNNTAKTVIVSGTFNDSITGGLVPNADVLVRLPDKSLATTKTNALGMYSVSIAMPNNSLSRDIEVSVSAPGYPNSMLLDGENDVIITVPDQVSPILLSQDFYLSKVPQDTVSTVPDTSGCRTTAPDLNTAGPDDYWGFYHPGDYVSQRVNGVLYCAAENNAVVLTNYADAIATAKRNVINGRKISVRSQL